MRAIYHVSTCLVGDWDGPGDTVESRPALLGGAVHPYFRPGMPLAPKPPKRPVSPKTWGVLRRGCGCGLLAGVGLALVTGAALLVPAVEPSQTDGADGVETRRDPVVTYLDEQAAVIDSLLGTPEGDVTLTDVEGALTKEVQYIDRYTNGDDAQWFSAVDNHPHITAAWEVEDCLRGYEALLSTPDRDVASELAVRADCAETIDLVDSID